ncbi:DUF6685 family protein [Paucibacter soli]|uniref:DUF6685 family protein n=1 Tax=Paucibacter soli TaxID=3133433 RepID=UPI0030A3BE5C
MSIPPEVLKFNEWPIWRRWVGLPDFSARQRILAWGKLDGLLPGPWQKPLSMDPWLPRAGIFGESVLRLDLLAHCGSWDRNSTVASISSGQLKCSELSSSLVKTRILPNFQCDILDVDGIAASKSAELPFKDVDEFGCYFAEEQGASVDTRGLEMMLRHPEIRVIHAPGIDQFHVSMWDGRLFLSNAGGSHHFAGAAYIARRLGAVVPLAADVVVSYLNVPLWNQLLDSYEIVQVPTWISRQAMSCVSKILGECLMLTVPERFGDGPLLFIPRNGSASGVIKSRLAAHGCLPLSQFISDLIRAQEECERSMLRNKPTLAQALKELGAGEITCGLLPQDAVGNFLPSQTMP